MEIKSEELLAWYLAMLRKNVRDEASQLTPMTLIETDNQLIQEIVISSQPGEKQRSLDILAQLKARNKGTRLLNHTILALAMIASVAALIILVACCCL